MKSEYIIGFLFVLLIQSIMAFLLYICLVDGSTVGLVLAGIYITFGYLKNLNIVLISKGKLRKILDKQFLGKTSGHIKHFNAVLASSVLLSTGVVTFFTLPFVFVLFNVVYLTAFVKIAHTSKEILSDGSYCTTG